MSAEDELKKLREQIDGIDDRIRSLILERASCAQRVAEVKRAADYVTRKPGGRGAVREVVEMILKAQGRWDRLVRELLTR